MMFAHTGYVTAHRDGGNLMPDRLKQSLSFAFNEEDIANIPPGLEHLEREVLGRIREAGGQ